MISPCTQCGKTTAAEVCFDCVHEGLEPSRLDRHFFGGSRPTASSLTTDVVKPIARNQSLSEKISRKLSKKKVKKLGDVCPHCVGKKRGSVYLDLDGHIERQHPDLVRIAASPTPERSER